MKYLIVKVYLKTHDIEHGKSFNNAADALNEATKLNQLAKENDAADIFSFMVLPCGAE